MWTARQDKARAERLQKVVLGCFFEGRPMRELAEELGVTESRISQLRAEGRRCPQGWAW